MPSPAAPADPLAALPAAVRQPLGRGDLPSALAALQRHAKAAPRDVNALHVLGELLFTMGRPQEAEAALGRALALAPDYVPALLALGLLLLRGQRPAEAAARLAEAARLQPGDGRIQTLLIQAEAQAGHDPRHTVERLEALVRADTANPDLLNDLGNALLKVGRPNDAAKCYRRALAAAPGHGPALSNLTTLLASTGQLSEAVILLQQAAAATRAPGICLHLAQVLIVDHRPGEALAALSDLLAAPDRSTEVLTTAARAHVMRGNTKEAVALADEALARDPRCAEALCARAAAHEILGEKQQRLADLTAAAEIAPTGPTLRQAALAANAAQRIDLAILHAIRALFLNTPAAAIAETAADSVRRDGDLPEALYAALPAEPSEEMVDSLAFLCLVCATCGCFRPLQRLRHHLQRPSNDIRFVHYSFASNYDPSLTAEQAADIYRAHHGSGGTAGEDDASIMTTSALAVPALLIADKAVLRVGFLSPDFRRHAVMKFLGPVLANLDRDRFRIHAYAELRAGDDRTREVQALVDDFKVTTMKRTEDVAALVRADGIDILVDAAGRTAGNRLAVFAHRAAPVQATWLGYGSTTGAAGADYFLGDGIMVPVGADHLFTEKVVRLPDAFTSYEGATEAPAVSPDLPALRNGHVTFGVPSRLIRLNDDLLRCWAELLRRLPEARLVIDSSNLHDPFASAVTQERVRALGLPVDRVRIANAPTYWDFFTDVDIVLDCFPHSSGTTSVEAMWMGVPVITVADRPPVGRIGASLVAAAGHPEWVAWSRSEYLTKAEHLAADVDRLAALRRTLRTTVQASRLCDGARFTRHMEEAFRLMWRQTCAGDPRALRVPPTA